MKCLISQYDVRTERYTLTLENRRDASSIEKFTFLTHPRNTTEDWGQPDWYDFRDEHGSLIGHEREDFLLALDIKGEDWDHLVKMLYATEFFDSYEPKHIGAKVQGCTFVASKEDS